VTQVREFQIELREDTRKYPYREMVDVIEYEGI